MRPTHTNADMSHQNGIVYKISVFFKSLKANGIMPTIRKIGQRAYLKAKGVDFTTQNIYNLTRIGEHQNHGTALVSSSEDYIKQLIADLESVVAKPLDKNIFIDYGSGKGAAIIHAKKVGFKKTIGIEFAKELHEIAVKNIKKMNLKGVNSYYADATAYIPPNDVSVIYFFNPFDEVVMEKVVKNIMNQKENFENDVYVIYANASCNLLEDYFSLLKKVTYKSGSTADYYKI